MSTLCGGTHRYLKDQPLETLLVDTEQGAAAAGVDWRTPQCATNNSLRCLQEALHFVLRRHGATQPLAKLGTFLVRERLLGYIANDLLGQTALEKSDRRLIDLVCEEIAHGAAKLGEGGQLNAARLRAVKHSIDDVRARMEGLPMRDASMSANPPPLTLTDKDGPPHKYYELPLFGHLHRTEDVDGFIGNIVPPASYVPVDLLRIPSRCTTYDDALRAIRYCDHQCLLLSQQQAFVVNRDQLILSTICHTFTEVGDPPILFIASWCLV